MTVTGAPVLHSTTWRLGYADTDPAGILYYAAWFPLMERTQSEWFFDNGMRQDTLADRHGYWMVTRHTECDYLVAVGLYDRSFSFGFGMTRLTDDRPVARAAITLVTVDAAGDSVPIPPPLRDVLEHWHAGRPAGLPPAPDERKPA
jgi:acyl-CoA thioester hydrolase